jgi:hypothetical protein
MAGDTRTLPSLKLRLSPGCGRRSDDQNNHNPSTRRADASGLAKNLASLRLRTIIDQCPEFFIYGKFRVRVRVNADKTWGRIRHVVHEGLWRS